MEGRTADVVHEGAAPPPNASCCLLTEPAATHPFRSHTSEGFVRQHRGQHDGEGGTEALSKREARAQGATALPRGNNPKERLQEQALTGLGRLTVPQALVGPHSDWWEAEACLWRLVGMRCVGRAHVANTHFERQLLDRSHPVTVQSPIEC